MKPWNESTKTISYTFVPMHITQPNQHLHNGLLHLLQIWVMQSLQQQHRWLRLKLLLLQVPLRLPPHHVMSHRHQYFHHLRRHHVTSCRRLRVLLFSTLQLLPFQPFPFQLCSQFHLQPPRQHIIQRNTRVVPNRGIRRMHASFGQQNNIGIPQWKPCPANRIRRCQPHDAVIHCHLTTFPWRRVVEPENPGRSTPLHVTTPPRTLLQHFLGLVEHAKVHPIQLAMLHATITVFENTSSNNPIFVVLVLISTFDIAGNKGSKNRTYSVVNNANDSRHERDNLIKCLVPKWNLLEIHNLSPIKHDLIIEAFNLHF